jgi:RHS repeat-associated protein
MTYPSGRQVRSCYSSAGQTQSAGRIQTVGNVVNGVVTPYATVNSYASHGAITQMTFGNQVVEQTTYDPLRLQPTQIQTGSLLTLNYSYQLNCPPTQNNCNPTRNNGNLVGQSITRGSNVWTQAYLYDTLDQLTSAGETVTLAGQPGPPSSAWSEADNYDNVGNRWVTNPVNLPTLTLETPVAQSWYLGNNQIAVWGYDGSGNVTSIQGMSRIFTYDGENRQLTASIIGNLTTYVYDGDGRRVQKITSAGTTTFVYDAAGQLAAEYSTAGPTDAGTSYLSDDHLGSTRLIMNATTGNKPFDYRPFGEELLVGTGGRTTAMGFNDAMSVGLPDKEPLKFTGKERDSETGLDFFGARYFSGPQGRFMSPDQGAYKLEDPQTLNRYAYVSSNPLKHIDPTGKEAEYVIDEKNKTIKIRASITIYGPKATAAYAAKLKAQMESAWKGSYKDPKTGATYKVSTTADVSVYDPLRGVGLSARNGFYVGDDVSRSSFQYQHTDPRFGARLCRRSWNLYRRS